MTTSIILIISIICFIFSLFLLIKTKSIKVQKEKEQKEVNQLKERFQQLSQNINKKENNLNVLNNEIKNKTENLDNLNIQIKRKEQQAESKYQTEITKVRRKIEEFKEVSNQAANSYINTLQEGYKHAEARYKEKITGLQAAYSAAAADLQTLKDTQKAAYEALLKEKEVKENKDNYRLIPSEADLQDIHALEKIKKTLHKPRVLSMLIWQNFWQPLAKEKFPIILQAKTKQGIYKITNLQTNQSYIGQSLDIYKRWSQHCKAGLGIDTPAGNKLYKSILEDGLQNFTFEVLCQCSKEQLNAKEKYFIELYQSDLYGLNSTAGNKK